MPCSMYIHKDVTWHAARSACKKNACCMHPCRSAGCCQARPGPRSVPCEHNMRARGMACCMNVSNNVPCHEKKSVRRSFTSWFGHGPGYARRLLEFRQNTVSKFENIRESTNMALPGLRIRPKRFASNFLSIGTHPRSPNPARIPKLGPTSRSCTN